MFSKIVAKNLFSWEDLSYEIKPGISQITGFNYDDCSPEGCGKSSIPNILCWVLYGGVPKDVRVDDVVRQGCKSGSGEVLLSSGFRVVRSRKPNDICIIKPNGDNLKGKDAKETQLLINNLIGLDFDAFCQTIYFAQNYPKKFVAASDTEKAGILSQVLDLTVFDRGRKRAHDLHKKEETCLQLVQSNLLRVEMEISKLKSNASLLADFVAHFQADKDSKLEQVGQTKRKLRENIKTLTELTHPEGAKTLADDLAKVEKRLEALATSRVQLGTSIKLAESAVKTRRQLEQTIEFASSKIEKLAAKLDRFKHGDNSCPTCGEPVKNHKVGVVFQETAEWQEDLEGEIAQREQAEIQLKNLPALNAVDDSKKQLVEVEKEGQALKAAREQLWEETSELKRYQDTLASHKKSLQALDLEQAKIEASECSEHLINLEKIDQQLTDALLVHKELSAQKNSLLTNMSKLEILKTGFKEVKQFVFQTLLSELSVKATRLAQDLFEVPINIRFSNEDEEGGVTKIVTTVTLDGNERPLGLYSGGQYRRIELAVDLALASIVAGRSHNPLKFRVLDEPFKDLSEASMEKVVKLLERLEGSTILIEHNSITKTIIHNVFDIEYRDGISRATYT